MRPSPRLQGGACGRRSRSKAGVRIHAFISYFIGKPHWGNQPPARRVFSEYPEPRVRTFLCKPAIAPERRHFDVLFLLVVPAEAAVTLTNPPWHGALEWFPVGMAQALRLARQRECLNRRGTIGPSAGS